MLNDCLTSKARKMLPGGYPIVIKKKCIHYHRVLLNKFIFLFFNWFQKCTIQTYLPFTDTILHRKTNLIVYNDDKIFQVLPYQKLCSENRCPSIIHDNVRNLCVMFIFFWCCVTFCNHKRRGNGLLSSSYKYNAVPLF